MNLRAACKRKQQGITIVEFSILASVLLLILFGIIEIGIFAYQLQTLNDISRRAARIAAVCPVGNLPEPPETADTPNIAAIKTLALSEGAPEGFTADNISIEYLQADAETPVDSPATDDHQGNIQFVRTRIVNFEYSFFGLLSFMGDRGIITVPDFQTTLPSESLGVLRINDTSVTYSCM